MMLARFGHLPSESPPDAADAGCFGAPVKEAAELMLVILAALVAAARLLWIMAPLMPMMLAAGMQLPWCWLLGAPVQATMLMMLPVLFALCKKQRS